VDVHTKTYNSSQYDRKRQSFRGARGRGRCRGGRHQQTNRAQTHHVSAYHACAVSVRYGEDFNTIDSPTSSQASLSEDADVPACQVDVLSISCDKNDRLFDSGASANMVNDVSSSSTFASFPAQQV
jgi:hypothetical protein